MEKAIGRLGFYAGAIGFLAAAGYGVVQGLQILQLVHYPYDDLLIYSFSLGIAPPFFLAFLCLHYSALSYRRPMSHAALLMATCYLLVACIVYTVQLAVAIPAELKGQRASVEAIAITPHSFFWTLDGLAYTFMSLASLFAALAIRRAEGTRRVRLFLLLNGLVLPLVLIVYFYPRFSVGLLLIASPWIVTAPGSLLLISLYFRRSARTNNHPIQQISHRWKSGQHPDAPLL